MKKRRIILSISVLILLVIGVWIIESMYNKPHISVSNSKPKITILSQALLQDFESNESQANSKYLEEIIQVTGKISELDITRDQSVIALSADNAMGGVLCHLSSEQSEKTNSLKVGQYITLKGICTGYLMDVVLVKCVIVDY